MLRLTMLRFLIVSPRSRATTRRRQLLRRLRAVTLALVSSLLLAGCSLLGGGDEASGSDPVIATLEGESLTIENRGNQKIWTFVVGRDAQAVIEWVPYLGEDGLAPGEQKTIDLEDVTTFKDLDSDAA